MSNASGESLAIIITDAVRRACRGEMTISEAVALVPAGEIGTFLHTSQQPIAARKQWLAGHLQVRGRLVLDEGAVRVLRESGRSLLPVGVREVRGDFTRGELVACVGPDGREVAKGLVNYNADEARRIMGLSTRRIQEVLGYSDDEELIHRDNLVVI